MWQSISVFHSIMNMFKVIIMNMITYYKCSLLQGQNVLNWLVTCNQAPGCCMKPHLLENINSECHYHQLI